MSADRIEPTLAAMREAAEHARAANHAAYGAPRTPWALYERTGALHDLLIKTEQLAEMLGAAAARLAHDPPAGLYADDGTDPAYRARAAAGRIRTAAERIAAATEAVNSAWSHLSHLGVDQ